MDSYPVYTVTGGTVEVGASVVPFRLRGPGVDIPAILVGEEGRGRRLGVLPVRLSQEQLVELEGGQVTIQAAALGRTQSDRPKLLAASGATCSQRIIVVLRTPIGFRGSNAHTGDALPSEHDADRPTYAEWPGEDLATGVIAQGDAGRAGGGHQLVSVLPSNTVWRVGYSGRLYGAPSAHYYLWNEEQLICATLDERQLGDLF